MKIDADNSGIVIEELDDTHLLVKQNMVSFLKTELNRLLSQNTYNAIDEDDVDKMDDAL